MSPRSWKGSRVCTPPLTPVRPTLPGIAAGKPWRSLVSAVGGVRSSGAASRGWVGRWVVWSELG